MVFCVENGCLTESWLKASRYILLKEEDLVSPSVDNAGDIYTGRAHFSQCFHLLEFFAGHTFESLSDIFHLGFAKHDV